MLAYAKKYRSMLWALAFVPLTACSFTFPWEQKEPQPLAQPLPVDDKPKRLAIGDTTVVGVKADGTVWGWGSSLTGELGSGQVYLDQATPTQIPNMTNFMEVATGGRHYLALRKDGTVWSWGDNRCGQLGYETEPQLTGWDKKPSGDTYSVTPKQIKELTDVISVAAGSSFSVALTRNGDVYSFGCNDGGQLGLGYADEIKNNNKTRHIIPKKVGNIPNGLLVSSGVSNYAIIDKNKNLWVNGKLYDKEKDENLYFGLFKININKCVDVYLGYGNDIYFLNEIGVLSKAKVIDYKENNIIINNNVIANDYDIIKVGRSFDDYLVLRNNKKIYHIYKGSKLSIPDIDGVFDIYSNGKVFAALSEDGKVYFWGDYSHGVRGLGNPDELGTRYLAATTKRGKTPEVSLWTWK